mmetsp:Transcript_38729/g.91398  ORF Transcript_38729/g.91398 Transcript_38729/m.91398 type:complete len:199 (+) Transcript_38729:31-627(+)
MPPRQALVLSSLRAASSAAAKVSTRSMRVSSVAFNAGSNPAMMRANVTLRAVNPAASAHWRLFHASSATAAGDIVSEGLESDPVRGVRLDQKTYPNFPKPEVDSSLNGSEYENVLERDPDWNGNKEGDFTGPNDEVWGEWGLDREAPWMSTQEALLSTVLALSGFYWFFNYILTPFTSPLGKREGIWTLEGREGKEAL